MQLENIKGENGKEPDIERDINGQKTIADSALKQHLEAAENQRAFLKKHSLGKWGFLISFFVAAGFVLVCVFSDVRETGLVIPICIVGFIIVFLVCEFLLCLIVDSALRARHKEERDKLRKELTDTKNKFYEEEKKYLEMWCNENDSKIYTVVIDEEVKKPTTEQIHAITRHTGCQAQKAELILRKQDKSDRMRVPRDWAIQFLTALLESGVKASLETYDYYE